MNIFNSKSKLLSVLVVLFGFIFLIIGSEVNAGSCPSGAGVWTGPVGTAPTNNRTYPVYTECSGQQTINSNILIQTADNATSGLKVIQNADFAPTLWAQLETTSQSGNSIVAMFSNQNDVNYNNSDGVTLVVADATANPEIQLQYGNNTNSHWSIYSNGLNNNNFNIWGGNDYFSILGVGSGVDAGNVGIGVPRPWEKLQVGGVLRVNGDIASGNFSSPRILIASKGATPADYYMIQLAQFDDGTASGYYDIGLYNSENKNTLSLNNEDGQISFIPGKAGSLNTAASTTITGAGDLIVRGDIQIDTLGQGIQFRPFSSSNLIRNYTGIGEGGLHYNTQFPLVFQTDPLGAFEFITSTAPLMAIRGSDAQVHFAGDIDMTDGKAILVPTAGAADNDSDMYIMNPQGDFDWDGNVSNVTVEGEVNAGSLCIRGDCHASWSVIGSESGWSWDNQAVVRLTYATNTVGIGTNSPDPLVKLHVAGSGKFDGRIEADGGLTDNLVMDPDFSTYKAESPRWTPIGYWNPELNYLNNTTYTNTAKMSNNGDRIIESDFIPINPLKTYKISVWVRSDREVGRRQLGFYSYNNSFDQLPAYNSSGGSSPTNWFYYGTPRADEWFKITGYLYPAEEKGPYTWDKLGNPPDTSQNNYELHPDAEYLKLLLYNGRNLATVVTNWWAIPKVEEVTSQSSIVMDDLYMVDGKSISIPSATTSNLYIGNYNDNFGFLYNSGYQSNVHVEGDVVGSRLCLGNDFTGEDCITNWGAAGGNQDLLSVLNEDSNAATFAGDTVIADSFGNWGLQYDTVYIGSNANYGGHAYFGHKNITSTAGNYALLQLSSGATSLNSATDTELYIRKDDDIQAKFDTEGRFGIGNTFLITTGDYLNSRFRVDEGDPGQGTVAKFVNRGDGDGEPNGDFSAIDIMNRNGTIQTAMVRFDTDSAGWSIGIDGYTNDNFAISNSMSGKLDSGQYFAVKTDGDVVIGHGSTYGDVYARSFITASDERLKKNFQDINGPLDIINKLHGVYFDWKANDERAIGVIAQEVEKILPEVVYTNDDGYKFVNYNELVPVLIEAIKEQQVQIEDLEKRLEYLESNFEIIK